jgi:glycosyltransferase involved in cell wall biosynthesis
VVAIVPARDEAEVIGRSIGILAAQDYPGRFRIILVDDGSSDGTADIARARCGRTARDPPGQRRCRAAGPASSGRSSRASPPPAMPAYLWLTDADIAHAPDTLRSLVARAEAGGCRSFALMAKLRCDTAAERMLIPAFVFFFQMLYPFARVNRPPAASGAAAGGCMLVRREPAHGGRHRRDPVALIDDCALGR